MTVDTERTAGQIMRRWLRLAKHGAEPAAIR